MKLTATAMVLALSASAVFADHPMHFTSREVEANAI